MTGEVSESLWTRRPPVRSAASSTRSRPGWSTASRSIRARRSTELRARGRVDDAGQPLVRPARRERLPRCLSPPPRAEMELRLQGRWDNAEEQAAQACEELGAYFNSPFRGSLRSGKSGGGAASSPRRRRPTRGERTRPPHRRPAGLASLRLAQGRDSAAAAVRRALESDVGPTHSREPPTRPGRDRARGRRAGQGARGGNRARGDRRPVSDPRRTHPPHGRDTAATLGRIRIAERDFEGAMAAAKAARSTSEKVGVLYQAALARMLLGLVYRGEEDEHSARERSKPRRRRSGALGRHSTRSALLSSWARAHGKTFVFTDIVDSTKLLEAFGEEKWQSS